jgi:hypothetical protein
MCIGSSCDLVTLSEMINSSPFGVKGSIQFLFRDHAWPVRAAAILALDERHVSKTCLVQS